MSRPENPRFPHTCRIVRIPDPGPMEDQTSETPIEDDPMADDEELDSTETPGEQTQEELTQEPTDDEPTEIVIYEGVCRAYDKHTTSDKGEVITSYRGLAIPLTREDWEALGVVPLEGDKIVVDRGGYEEYGIVIDKNPSNFGGTHLIWRYGRN